MPWYSEKVGPLPAGVWIAVIVVGVGGGLIWQRRQSEGVPMVSTGADTGAGELTTAGSTVYQPGGGAITLPSPPVTNAEWATMATNILTQSHPEADPGVISAALQAYIAGSVLTVEQTVWKNLAVLALGLPPQPVKSVTTTPTPTPTPTHVPHMRTVRGQFSGGTPVKPTVAFYFAKQFRGLATALAQPNVVGHYYNLVVSQNPALRGRRVLPKAMWVTVTDVV